MEGMSLTAAAPWPVGLWSSSERTPERFRSALFAQSLARVTQSSVCRHPLLGAKHSRLLWLPPRSRKARSRLLRYEFVGHP